MCWTCWWQSCRIWRFNQETLQASGIMKRKQGHNEGNAEKIGGSEWRTESTICVCLRRHKRSRGKVIREKDADNEEVLNIWTPSSRKRKETMKFKTDEWVDKEYLERCKTEWYIIEKATKKILNNVVRPGSHVKVNWFFLVLLFFPIFFHLYTMFLLPVFSTLWTYVSLSLLPQNLSILNTFLEKFEFQFILFF